MTITRRLEWDMGHRVTNHGSKCRNLHGHRYVALVELSGPLIDIEGASDEGMVMDFADVKHRLGSWIDEMWDHGFMVWEKDQFKDLLLETNTKVILTPYVPTAENIATDLLRIGRLLLGDAVTAVTIWETPNCSARVER